jgi:hypothetical protein
VFGHQPPDKSRADRCVGQETVSGEQLDQPALQDWIQRLGLQAEWKLVSG